MARSSTQHGLAANKVTGRIAFYTNGFLRSVEAFFSRSDRQLKMAMYFLIIENSCKDNYYDIIITIDALPN
jgi:hypothetical protein